ncbi:MAG: TIGR03619 family F420-dependent LLM class oxidoreductase [bacterium]|nr:TIGR03619 family F420-dependent LLM class oxidoreductase [bacterium]
MTRITSDGEILCGIQLPIQAQSELLRQPWEPDATVADLVAIAQTAEEAGLGFVGVCDHIAIPDNDYAAHMSTTWYDTVATLSYLAAHTGAIRLLSEVYVIAYRHPLMTAKAFTTLDRLSGGRAIMGVGTGHVEAEFEALGLNFADRGRMADEAIDAVRAAVEASGGFCEFSGEFYRFKNMGVGPAAVQREIPIWVGGSSRPALRRVAERGDGWIPMHTPREAMAEQLDYIRAHAEAVGRDPNEIDFAWMAGSIHVGEPTEGVLPSARPGVSGPPEQVAEWLRYAHDLGASVLFVWFRARDVSEYRDQIAAFGADVLPLLAA